MRYRAGIVIWRNTIGFAGLIIRYLNSRFTLYYDICVSLCLRILATLNIYFIQSCSCVNICLAAVLFGEDVR